MAVGGTNGINVVRWSSVLDGILSKPLPQRHSTTISACAPATKSGRLLNSSITQTTTTRTTNHLSQQLFSDLGLVATRFQLPLQSISHHKAVIRQVCFFNFVRLHRFAGLTQFPQYLHVLQQNFATRKFSNSSNSLSCHQQKLYNIQKCPPSKPPNLPLPKAHLSRPPRSLPVLLRVRLTF